MKTQEITVVKIGGNVIEDPIALEPVSYTHLTLPTILRV